MSNSTRKPPAEKPDKPYPDFPLFAHRNGQWAKKVRGKLLYFGSWSNLDGAMQRWLDQRDDLLAGRKPRVSGDGLTVADLANRYLDGKMILVRGGELNPRTWRDYQACCVKLVDTLGRDRFVVDLASDDFEHLRSTMGETLGSCSLKVEMQRIRSIFKYAYDAGLIDRPVRFGPLFRSPSNRVIQKTRRDNGPRMFEASEIRQMLDAARPLPKAMILLGINCAFGNNDCALLPKSALDLDGGWVDFPRPKTEAPRRCPLWPETVEALAAAIAVRPAPQDPGDNDLVFVTTYGNRWVRLNGTSWTDAVTIMTRELLTKLELKRPGLNFYALRHTFETVAGESLDQVGTNAIMGHVDSSMAGHYRERVTDDRLRAVVKHIHEWLFSSMS